MLNKKQQHLSYKDRLLEKFTIRNGKHTSHDICFTFPVEFKKICVLLEKTKLWGETSMNCQVKDIF